MVESPLGESVPAVDGSQGPYLRAEGQGGIQRAWVEVLNKDDYPDPEPRAPHEAGP